MKVIDPTPITDAMIVEASIPENDHAEWDDEITYNVGDRVILTATHRIYEALAASTNVDPATDDGTTWLDVGATNRWRCFDGSLQSSVTDENSIRYVIESNVALNGLALFGLVGGTLKVRVWDTENLLVNSGFSSSQMWQRETGWTISGGVASYTAIAGTPVASISQPVALISGRLYRVLFEITSRTSGYVQPAFWDGTDHTLGTTQYSVGAYKEEIRAGEGDNHFRMRGNGVSSGAAISVDNIGLIQSLYDVEIPLVDNSVVAGWWSYFYEPLRQKAQVVLDIPLLPGMQVEIEVTGDNVEIGEIVLGTTRALGTAMTGAQIGLLDFSRKERDDFGNFQIVERGYAKTVNFPFAVPAMDVSRIERSLASLRARPAVYYAAQPEMGAVVYGFLRDFSVDLISDNIAFATLEVEGLT